MKETSADISRQTISFDTLDPWLYTHRLDNPSVRRKEPERPRTDMDKNDG